ncbi:hypothetical protein JCM10207_004155 [Rhodosporidiobolus poonsookiae]
MASPASSQSTLTPLPSSAAPLSPLRPSDPQPATPYTAFRKTITAVLRSLISETAARRDAGQLDEAKEVVERAMQQAGAVRIGEVLAEERWKGDTRAAATARALEKLAHEAAVFPADEAAFAHLQDVLDLILVMFEAGYADEGLPLNILTSLMELRPITACEPLFGYIESRIDRLTKGMEYQRGRGPILLRLLNDLLRRLPRSQSTTVILSGRILMLLSSVFPLGEKSGVNLRGNFNTGKGAVWEDEARKEMQGAVEDAEKEEKEGKEKMEVEEGEEEEPAKEAGSANPAQGNPSAFYTTFWSLQRIFNNPPLLFAPTPATSTSSSPAPSDPFTTLHSGLRQTLAAFAAATKREKELAGAAKDDKPAAGGKENLPVGEKEVEMDETSGEQQALEEYFFPKFLTSRNLLDLELADPAFRRQLLVQSLILLQYLLTLTPTSRARASTLPVTNVAALPAFVLPEETEKWVREVRSRVLDELDSMDTEGPGSGRRFRKAVGVVLQREQNWTDWKLRSCFPFVRTATATPAAQSDTARARLRALSQRPKAFPYKLGNPQLSRAWMRNTTSLEGMEVDSAADDLDQLFREHRLEKGRIRQDEQQLQRAAPGSDRRAELEQSLEHRRTRLQALQWRAIRTASSRHLNLFSSIGAGDLDTLQSLIDAERRAREEEEEARIAAAEAAEGGTAEEGMKEGAEEEGEGYDSDRSALDFTGEKRERERVEQERKAKEEAERAVKDKEEEERKRREKEKEEEEAAEKKRKEEAATEEKVKQEERERSPGTPEPLAPPLAASAAGADTAMSAADDEPGTPPPREPEPQPEREAEAETDAARLPSPGTPETPKRPRPDEDEEMRDGEGREGKRQRNE